MSDFDHYRDTGLLVLSSIQRICTEYRALLEHPALTSLSAGRSYNAATGTYRPTWLVDITSYMDALERSLQSARSGANK